MLLDAILHQVLLCDPYTLARWCFVVVAIVGIVASLVAPIFAELLDNTPKAKARRKAMMPREAQTKIDVLSRRILEAHDRETGLRKENHELRRLVAAESNWGRNHRADVQASVGLTRRER